MARLFELLEHTATRSPEGNRRRLERGDVGEIVARCAWAKADVVARDEREETGREGGC